MVDDVKDITENAESKVSSEALDRARLARERREAEQRKRLEELRAHAAAAQAQREKRDEERRRRQQEARARDDDRRHQVEERKRAIWEASISRREALLQREREREERLERSRQSRSSPRSAFAFGSSTPRLLEPVDTTGFFWAARSTNPIDQMNFFESLASSTTNVMFASAPLTRRASALQLDSEQDNKDEPERSPQQVIWSSVARRRTDLVPTLPAPRGPGRAYSMTRLDRIPSQRPLHSGSPSMYHLNRQSASGASTPGSRPGSALSNCTAGGGGVVRRQTPRRPRPASIAGTGVNTPRGGGDGVQALSQATTPSVSRDASSTNMAAGDVPRRPPSGTPRRPRPVSLHAARPVSATTSPAVDGKPPLHRKPKLSKEHERANRNKSLSVSPGRGTVSPSPHASKESSVDKELINKSKSSSTKSIDKSVVNPREVTQKLEALQVNGDEPQTHQNLDAKVNENKESIDVKAETKMEQTIVTEEKPTENPLEKPIEEPVEIPIEKPVEVQKHVEKKEERKEEKKEERREEKKDAEKPEESDMTASMISRRITTEEEAKAALAERRRKAREELERQAELERQRLQREAEEEAERQRVEEERQRREEEEAKELARLQRQMDEEKLRKAIEAQQQLEKEEAERKVKEEAEKLARLKEEEEKRKALEEEMKLKREEAEKEEKERLARKQRVEAIMARTRLRKAEEDKKQQDNKAPQPQNQTAESQNPSENQTAPSVDAEQTNNGNKEVNNGNANTADLLGLSAPQNSEEQKPLEPAQTESSTETKPNNGNLTADLLGLSEHNNTEDKIQEQTSTTNKVSQPIDNAPTANAPTETNNGNVQHGEPANVGHISANFIQTERMSNEQQKLDKFEDDFTTHNGHGTTHNHPLTLQNAI